MAALLKTAASAVFVVAAASRDVKRDAFSGRTLSVAEGTWETSFEENIVGDLTPYKITAKGFLWPSDEQAFTGLQSLKVKGAGGGYNRNFLTIDLEGTPFEKRIFGKMMVLVDEPMGSNGGDFTLVQAEGPPKANWVAAGAPNDTNVMYRMRVDGRDQDGFLFANYDTYVDKDDNGETDWLTDCWDKGDTQLVRKTWTCLEWKFDSATNELQYWQNNVEIPEIHVVGSGEGCVGDVQGGNWTAPATFKKLHVGIEQYHDDAPPRTIYIDDLAVSTLDRIGC